MARTIDEIKTAIKNDLNGSLTLSSSAVAEWRLWVNVVAVAIYSFELILDAFKRDIELSTEKITPGTLKWYIEMCYRFQNGYELTFDSNTALLYYTVDDAAAKIIAVAAVTEVEGTVVLRVAKKQNNKVMPLNSDELMNFKNYIDAVKFAGVKVSVMSSTEDLIRYNVVVYYDPVLPLTLVRQRCSSALSEFMTALDFGAVIYPQRFIDALMNIDGVATVQLNSLERKGATDNDYSTVDVMGILEAGYFNYAEDSIIEFVNIRE